MKHLPSLNNVLEAYPDVGKSQEIRPLCYRSVIKTGREEASLVCHRLFSSSEMNPLFAFQVNPSRILKILGAIIFVLALFSTIGQYSAFFLDKQRLLGFVPEFDLARESNIPTYFSALLLLSASILIGVIARFVRKMGAPFYRHWFALSLIFVYLSVDEAASLHERLGEPVRAVLEPGGMFTYAWVIPGMGLLALFVLAYARFFFHLPSRWKVLFGGAGVLYVLGGLGCELVGGWYASQYGVTFTLSIITLVEEVLEMAGVACFIYALLEYVRAHISGVLIRFKKDEREEPAYAVSSEGAVSRAGALPVAAGERP